MKDKGIKMFMGALRAIKTQKANQKGYTLIELIVVIAIIGILVAIAVPVYGSVQQNARANIVKATAQNGLTAASAAIIDDDPATKGMAALSTSVSPDVNAVLYGTTSADLCVLSTWRGGPAGNPTSGTPSAAAGPGAALNKLTCNGSLAVGI